MTKRIVVTGATGFVGTRLVAKLRQQGHDVVGLARRGGDENCDLADGEQLKSILGRLAPSLVYHLAAFVTGGRDKALLREMYRTHVVGTHMLTKALTNTGTRIIGAGSYAEMGDAPAPYFAATPARPVSPYGYTKLLSTEQLRIYAITQRTPTMVLRAANLYGPGQRPNYFVAAMLGALQRGETFGMTPGEQVRDFLYVDDFVTALVAAADMPAEPSRDEHNVPFHILYVGSGEPTSLKQLAVLAERVTKTSGLIELGAKPYRNNEQMRMVGDISHAVELLNWQPRHPLEEGLRLTIESMQT